MSRRAIRAIPHVRALMADGLTPVTAYRRLGRLSPVRFLLESVTGGEQVSRFSFLGAAPREILRLWPDRIERQVARGDGITGELGSSRVVAGSEDDPLGALRRLLGSVRAERGPIPLSGGFVGWFGYDTVRLVEHLPDRPPESTPSGGLPWALLGRFDDVVVFDHAHQRILAIANEIRADEGAEDGDGTHGEEAGSLRSLRSVAEAEAALDRLAEALALPADDEVAAVPLPTPAGGGRPAPPPAEEMEPPSISAADYRAAVETAREHIAAGDIFQVVLARRFAVGRRHDPLALYRALRVINPSPYMVLFEAPDLALAGASPEMLVRKTGDRLETRPIAGTRPRGGDAAADKRLADELLADPKERAEHLMLVDLGRNDLGRVSRPGTVEVASFMEVERYSHVMHLVSSVEGRLADGRDALDALLACFPAGTLSGAPKIRAMEIIDALEPEARGPYGGAVGYLSYGGDLDACITIRTLVVEEGRTSVTAGAGIVADSDPRREQEETENKAAGMLAAVALAARIEAAEERARSARKGVEP